VRIRIHQKSPLLRFFPLWVSAFVLGRHIFLRGRLAHFSDAGLRHELIHVGQYLELGIVRFLWRYFWTERRLSYSQKSLEREAYENEWDPDYLRRRWPGVRLESGHRH
jgi:hypothetical protein